MPLLPRGGWSGGVLRHTAYAYYGGEAVAGGQSPVSSKSGCDRGRMVDLTESRPGEDLYRARYPLA